MVAVKELRRESDNYERCHFHKEAELMACFSHENIVRLLGVVRDKERVRQLHKLGKICICVPACMCTCQSAQFICMHGEFLSVKTCVSISGFTGFLEILENPGFEKNTLENPGKSWKRMKS